MLKHIFNTLKHFIPNLNDIISNKILLLYYKYRLLPIKHTINSSFEHAKFPTV